MADLRFHTRDTKRVMQVINKANLLDSVGNRQNILCKLWQYNAWGGGGGGGGGGDMLRHITITKCLSSADLRNWYTFTVSIL